MVENISMILEEINASRLLKLKGSGDQSPMTLLMFEGKCTGGGSGAYRKVFKQ